MERTHYTLPDCSFGLLSLFSLAALGLNGALYLLLR